MLNKLNSPSISAPLGAYSHGIEIAIEAQLGCAWQNILADLGEASPSATAVCVSALAAPEFLCEIEVIAAKA